MRQTEKKNKTYFSCVIVDSIELKVDVWSALVMKSQKKIEARKNK